jgi:hypothetical protein
VDRPIEPCPATGETRESGRLVDLILRAVLREPPDRRSEPRHPVWQDGVWVGWWRDEGFETTSGRVRNLSRWGAEVVLGQRPPRKVSVWIYKEVESTVASVRGEMVGHTPAPGGDFAVRFRFMVPCPVILCQAIVGDGREARPNCGAEEPPGR